MTLTCFLHLLTFIGWFNARSNFFFSPLCSVFSACFRKWRLEKSSFFSDAKINSSDTYNLPCPTIFHNAMTIFNFCETSYANEHSQRECTKQDARAKENGKWWPFLFSYGSNLLKRGLLDRQRVRILHSCSGSGSKLSLPLGKRPRASFNWLPPAPIH